MPDTVSIDTLKLAQRDLELGEVHLVHVGAGGFTIAHTDAERAESTTTALEQCELHRWLLGQSEPPVDTGLYVVVPHEPDAYSEPYGADPFDFEPLDVFVRVRNGTAASGGGGA